LIIPIIELYRNKAEPIKNIAICFFQILYIGLPFSLCNYLIFPFGNETFSSHILLSVFLLVWTNDSGAYAVGVKFGRRRLFERISPKKSWEGSIGGAFFTFLGAYVISIFFKELSLIEWMGFAAIITVFAGYGDLVESMIKRSLKIKDSGNIIPGHGGFLDRFDAVLFAIPSIFIYMEILKRLA
jgi:phosphatidate cytidylyltransferase